MNIHLACNDPNNGNFAGEFFAIEVDAGDGEESLLTIDNPLSPLPMKIDREQRRLHIGHMKIHYTYSRDWYGNWCWNMYEIETRDVLRIIAYVRKHHWVISDGYEKIVNRWDDGLPIREEDLVI
jgi:hypothetical protein